MKVLGIYGSPRKKGNSDILLDKALRGAESEGAEIEKVYTRDLDIEGCIECDGCDGTGECVLDDDMQDIYPSLLDADAIILSSPIFFYAFPSKIKALIDRSQAMWCKRVLQKPKSEWKNYEGGKGYLIAVGATKGKHMFEGTVLTAKYFFDALDKSCEESLVFRGVEKEGDINSHPDYLEDAYRFGQKLAASK